MFLSKDAIIIFVCGAAIETNNGKNARNRFIEYATKHLEEYDIFIAENFFNLFKDKVDLLTIEDKLAKYSDCIILFLESASSIAELGAFSNNNDLVKQMLIINEVKFEGVSSFITNGPIEKTNNQSIYGCTIYCDMSSVLEVVGEIKKRLDKNKRKYNKGIQIVDFISYDKMTEKNKMLLLLDLITILQPITAEELVYVHKSIIGEGFYNIDFDLKLLTALGYVIKTNEYYIKVKRLQKMYHVFERDKSIIKMRSSVMNAYHKHDRSRINEYLRQIRIN